MRASEIRFVCYATSSSGTIAFFEASPTALISSAEYEDKNSIPYDYGSLLLLTRNCKRLGEDVTDLEAVLSDWPKD